VMAILRRFVMLWLLALAIPLQGLAAATMVHCGSSHQRMHDAVAPAHSHGGSSSHHHSHGVDHAVSMANATDHHDAAAADASADPDKYSDLAQYKCSACGACCSVAALPAFSLSVPTPDAVVQWEAVHFLARFGYFTDAPERPPRPILA
jgi:hypothetical protein